MIERTEAEGLSGLLPVTMGGQPHVLPVLTIARSEEWQRTLAHRLATAEVVPDTDDGEEMFALLLLAGGQARLDVVAAYDHTGVLGGRDAIRDAMTQGELREALEAMILAELPFEGAIDPPSVVRAFGEPVRVAMAALEAIRSLSERSPSGPSPTGGSTGSGTSGRDGPRSSSSSTGPMGSDGSSPGPASGATRSRTGSTRATSRSAS